MNSEMNRISSAKQQIMHLPGINKRQSSILAYMAEYPDDSFGIAEIAERFDVSYQTARTDLLELEAHGYLWAMKKGKAFFYSIDEELKKQF